MAADFFMVAVDWYGPLNSLKEARTIAKKHDVKDFLYLGYETKGKTRSYVGISNDANSRLRTSHTAIGKWPDNTYELWIGIVSSQAEAGRRPGDKRTRHKAALSFAERLIARFVETSENKHGSVRPPKRSGAVLSRWFKLADDFPRHKKQPHKNWPDFIEYEESEPSARNIYFGGRVEKFKL